MTADLPKNLPACVSRRVMLSSGAVMTFATAMALAGCSSDASASKSDATKAATASETGTASASAAAPSASTSAPSSSAAAPSESSSADSGSGPDPKATVVAGTTIIALSDLPENTAKVVTVNKVGVLVAREAGDKIVAFNAICTHQFLADVVVKDKSASCPAHDSVFNAFTGAVEKGPADNPLAKIAVKVDGANIVAA